MRIDFQEMEQDQFSNMSKASISSTSLLEIEKQPFFKDKKRQQNDKDEPQLSFEVNYPYEVNRLVAASALKNQMSYLRAQKILPASTLRFIQSSLTSEVLPNPESKRSSQQANQQQQIQQQSDCRIQIQQPLNKISQKTVKATKKKYHNIKPKVYEIKNNSKTKPYQKQYDLQDVTLRPILNYTMNSKVAKKVNNKRNNLYKTQKTNVFQSLYQDSGIYEIRKANKKKQNISKSKCQQKASRIQIYSTFEERLRTSIEKQGQRRKKAQNKLQFDLSTGQSLFVPDTSRSKITYLTHFKSLSSISQSSQKSICCHSSRFNHSQQVITNQRHSLSKQLNRLQDRFPIIRKPLPKQNKIAQQYASILWNQNKITDQGLEPRQRSILAGFLQLINNDTISKNLRVESFKFYFIQFYSSLNLFDKSVLQNRIKNKKQKDNQITFKQKRKQRQKRSSRLDHTYKHFFV